MINILDDKTQRKLQLIDLLIHSESEVTINTLSSVLGVSKSTVQRDIDFLNEHYSEYLSIQYDFNVLFLDNANSEKIYHLQHLLINSSANIKLLNEIFFNPFNKAKKYADCLNISISNIYKMIKKINLSLASYQIEIVVVNNKYFIEALSEITLRRLFSVYFSELNNFSCPNSVKKNKDLVSILNNLNLKIYEEIKLTQVYYSAFVHISLIREEQGFHLIKETSHFNISSHSEKQNTIINSLTYSPFTNNQLFNSRKLHVLKLHLESYFKEPKHADLLFQFISIFYHNEISDQIPPTIFINKFKHFYLSLKKQSHLFYPVQKMINDISILMGTNFKEYEVILSYILVVYFPDFLEKYDKKTVYVYSKLAASHADFLHGVLDNKFNKIYQFIVVKNKYFIEENISNSLFVTNDISIKSDNNFIINDYPKKIDLSNLEKKLSNFYFLNK